MYVPMSVCMCYSIVCWCVPFFTYVCTLYTLFSRRELCFHIILIVVLCLVSLQEYKPRQALREDKQHGDLAEGGSGKEVVVLLPLT